MGNASSQMRRESGEGTDSSTGVAAMNAGDRRGRSSYTSGAHIWNGTAATLNENPMSRSATPATSIGLYMREKRATRSPIVARFVDPVAPYTNAIPYSKKPVENAPSRKYFERGLRRSPRCGD